MGRTDEYFFSKALDGVEGILNRRGGVAVSANMQAQFFAAFDKAPASMSAQIAKVRKLIEEAPRVRY